MAMEKTFHIPRAGTVGLIVLVVIIAGLLYLAGWMFGRRADSMIGTVIGMTVTIPVALMFVWFLYQQGRSTLVLQADKLTLNVPWYGKQVSLDHVMVDQVRLLDGDDEEWAFAWRTNGIGLPQYQVGWFSTKGGHKVLAARTTGALVLIPTDHGYSLLVSVYDAERLVAELSGLSSD